MTESMADAVIFSDADPKRSARVAEAVGTRFAAATALAVPAMIHDAAISPADLSDGIIRAHLLGAVSMMVGARATFAADDPERNLIAERASLLWASLTEIATREHVG